MWILLCIGSNWFYPHSWVPLQHCIKKKHPIYFLLVGEWVTLLDVCLRYEFIFQEGVDVCSFWYKQLDILWIICYSSSKFFKILTTNFQVMVRMPLMLDNTTLFLPIIVIIIQFEQKESPRLCHTIRIMKNVIARTYFINTFFCFALGTSFSCQQVYYDKFIMCSYQIPGCL